MTVDFLEKNITNIQKIGMKKKNNFYLFKLLCLSITTFIWFIFFIVFFSINFVYFSESLNYTPLFIFYGGVGYCFLSIIIYGKYKINLLKFLNFLNFPMFIYCEYCNKKYSKIRQSYWQTIKLLKELKELKTNLYLSSKAFLKLSGIDIKSKSLDNKDSIGIKECLTLLEDIFKLYDRTLDYIDENTNILSYGFKDKKVFITYIEKILSNEKKFLFDVSTLNTENIKFWISHHQSELQELEKSIENQATQTINADGKLALESQKVRLQSYIESINNLVK